MHYADAAVTYTRLFKNSLQNDLQKKEPMIEPITLSQQQHVRRITIHYIQRASTLYRRSFDIIPVFFDLKGRSAGMYRVKNGERLIRYNPYIFAKYFDDNVAETVPHEVAHYITEKLYGVGCVRPHGREWSEIARAFGVKSKRASHQYDMKGIPVRVHQRFAYQCQCTTHNITSRRHKQVQNGVAKYLCRRCGEVIASTPSR